MTTSSTTPPTATSSNPSAVSVAYKGTCDGGYLFTITNQGSGQATITTKDRGRQNLFLCRYRQGNVPPTKPSSPTPLHRLICVSAQHTPSSYTVTGGGSPQFASGNTNFLQITKTVQVGNDYFITSRESLPVKSVFTHLLTVPTWIASVLLMWLHKPMFL